MLFLTLAVAFTVAPTPGELQSFDDWVVGCDNGLACRAMARIPQDGRADMTLVVERAAEALATATMDHPFDAFEPCGLFDIFVDGRRRPVSFGSPCPHPPGTPAPPPAPPRRGPIRMRASKIR